MTKPRLAKVRALFYVLQQLTNEAAPILTQPRRVFADTVRYCAQSRIARLLTSTPNSRARARIALASRGFKSSGQYRK